MRNMTISVASALVLMSAGCERQDVNEDPRTEAIEQEGRQRVAEIDRSLAPEAQQLELERQRIEQQRAQLEEDETRIADRQRAFEQRRDELVVAVEESVDSEQDVIERQIELAEAEREAAIRRQEATRAEEQARNQQRQEGAFYGETEIQEREAMLERAEGNVEGRAVERGASEAREPVGQEAREPVHAPLPPQSP